MPSNFEDLGLAALDSDTLKLRPDAKPTKSYQGDESYRSHLTAMAKRRDVNYKEHTEIDVLGPYFRPYAPFRAKITPPHEVGKTLVIKGRVWDFETKDPVGRVKMDIWQANAAGRYDNSDLKNPPAELVFKNRARLLCDRNGYYEFETIHPGPYKVNRTTWRAPHIHFYIEYPGYITLITQIFFEGDPYLTDDPYVDDSLIIPLRENENNGIEYEEGIFDIVLVPESDT